MFIFPHHHPPVLTTCNDLSACHAVHLTDTAVGNLPALPRAQPSAGCWLRCHMAWRSRRAPPAGLSAGRWSAAQGWPIDIGFLVSPGLLGGCQSADTLLTIPALNTGSWCYTRLLEIIYVLIRTGANLDGPVLTLLSSSVLSIPLSPLTYTSRFEVGVDVVITGLADPHCTGKASNWL